MMGEEEESRRDLNKDLDKMDDLGEEVGELMQGTIRRAMETMGAGTPQVQTPKLPPELKGVEGLIRELMDINTTLVIKVASNDCKNNSKCGVYKEAKRVAKIIDKLQALRPKLERLAKKKQG